MKLKSILNTLNFNQILLTLPLAYIGVLFAGKTEIVTWLWITIAVLSAKISHTSFHKINENKNIPRSPRYWFRYLHNAQTDNNSLWFSGLFFSATLIGASYMLNELCYYVSFVIVFILLLYPLLRKFSSLKSYYLGIFETFCPIAGFIAVQNRFEIFPFAICGAVLLWTAGFEIAFSMFDINFDNENKIFSIPARFNENRAIVISSILYLFSIIFFVFIGLQMIRGLAFWVSLVCFAVILIKQQQLLKSKDPESARKEFLQINNFITPILFTGTFIATSQ